MIRLYKGHRIEVVRLDENLSQRKRMEATLRYCITRLRDNALVAEGEYPAGWTVFAAIYDIKAAIDLERGVLDG